MNRRTCIIRLAACALAAHASFAATLAFADDPDGVVTLWHQLKKAEKPERQSALDGVPKALPALMRAEALQKKARNVGFDWPDAKGSLAKVREEIPDPPSRLSAAMPERAAPRTR